MKRTKTILTLLIVSLLAFNSFLISSSAYIEGPELLDVDINLEVGRYSGNVFTLLTPGEALYADDIITVRILPTTNFLVGITRYAVMFTKDYLEIVGSGKTAFTPNYTNPFYATVCNDYAGATNIPKTSWPPAMRTDGTYDANSAIAVNSSSDVTAPNGGLPGYLTGEWFFRFDLRVKQDITAGSGARVWMDNQWVRKPGYTNAQMYFTKCLDSEDLTTSGKSTIYNFNVDLSGANIDLEPSTDVNITFDANGGAGGTGPAAMQPGDALIAPTVTRPGYGFDGWSPAVPPTVPEENTVYTAQWTPTVVSVTQIDENTLAVNIKGWTAQYGYQIWTYQKVVSDLHLNGKDNVTANQWIVSQVYTPGEDGVGQPDGSISFMIGTFTSPNNNYTIAVRIVDENGNYLSEMGDPFTRADLDSAEITKVLVDGEYVRGSSLEDSDRNIKSTVVKEITPTAAPLIKVIGNLPGLTYTATVVETGEELTANGNAFTWDISQYIPQRYTVRVTASNASSTDTLDVRFMLYSSAPSVQYGTMNSLVVTNGVSPLTVPQTIGINPSFINGNFHYIVREMGRAANFTSGAYTASGNIDHDITKYGIYHVYGYANRPTIVPSESNYDDGIIKPITIKRSNSPSSMTISANPSFANPIAKGTPILIEANATIAGIDATPVEYSFYRYDAKGYILIKDWSLDNTLAWTPGRVGEYTIEVRAKGEDAGSYEVRKSVAVSIVYAGESIAQGVVITVNTAELNQNAKARTPITIKASATSSNSEDLLYRFFVYDDAMLTKQLQAYSANQECIWTPRKAGTYKISVQVKNQVSFGKWDEIKQVTVVAAE